MIKEKEYLHFLQCLINKCPISKKTRKINQNLGGKYLVVCINTIAIAQVSNPEIFNVCVSIIFFLLIIQ